MDETMKMIIGYGALLTGLPLVTAKILWLVPGAVLGAILAKFAARLDQVTHAAISGFLAILLTCLAFKYFDLPLVWEVPLLLIVVNSIWNWAKEEAFTAWSADAGIVIGFIFYPGVRGFLINRFGVF